MPSPFQIAILQSSCTSDPRANLEKTIQQIRDAAGRGANVVCTQELFRTQYFCQFEDPANFAFAESIPGPTTEALTKLARELGVAIVAGVFERRAAGVYHNTAAVIDADGALVGTYRKMHIPDDPLYYEKYYFTPGDAFSPGPRAGESPFRTFDTKFGRIGVLICWDQWFPEAARLTALRDCAVLFYPTAIGWHPRERANVNAAQRDAWITMQRSHAIANGLYVAAANRHGLEKLAAMTLEEEAKGASPVRGPGLNDAGLDFWGSSFVCDPFGQMLTQAATNEDAVLLATINPAKIEQTRQLWPFLRDRRIDAYGGLTTRFGR